MFRENSQLPRSHVLNHLTKVATFLEKPDRVKKSIYLQIQKLLLSKNDKYPRLLPPWVDLSPTYVYNLSFPHFQIEKCGLDVWQSLGPHEKITAVLLILAIATCLLLFLWSCISYFGCCCKSYLLTPMPILALVAVLFDLAAVLVYVLYDDKYEAKIEEAFDVTQRKYGYSMWFAVVAGIGLLVDVALGIAMICCATVSPV